MSNLRHAVRTLISQPVATAVVVPTIAVAIAATTVIYGAIDPVWGFIPVVDRRGLVCVASTDARVLQAQSGTQIVVPKPNTRQSGNQQGINDRRSGDQQ